MRNINLTKIMIIFISVFLAMSLFAISREARADVCFNWDITLDMYTEAFGQPMISTSIDGDLTYGWVKYEPNYQRNVYLFVTTAPSISSIVENDNTEPQGLVDFEITMSDYIKALGFPFKDVSHDYIVANGWTGYENSSSSNPVYIYLVMKY